MPLLSIGDWRPDVSDVDASSSRCNAACGAEEIGFSTHTPRPDLAVERLRRIRLNVSDHKALATQHAGGMVVREFDSACVER